MIVIDASVLTNALVDDGPVGDESRSALLEDPHWAAPAHLVVEVVSVIRGRHLGQKLSAQRAQDALAALQELSLESIDPAGLVDRMWQLRHTLTAYDAAYIAAGEDLGCSVLTADGKLGATRGVHCDVRVVAGN